MSHFILWLNNIQSSFSKQWALKKAGALSMSQNASRCFSYMAATLLKIPCRYFSGKYLAIFMGKYIYAKTVASRNTLFAQNNYVQSFINYLSFHTVSVLCTYFPVN